MKFIPILFSTPMVQALLEGRKTMTRREADVPNHEHMGRKIMDWGLSKHPWKDDEGQWWYNVQSTVDSYNRLKLKCKWQPGDVLWVRESFIHLPPEYDFALSSLYPYAEGGTFYKADKGHEGPGPWKPSIHMPKSLCRIFLEVTDVRVERLLDISEEDAKAEGAERGILRDGPNTEKGEFHLEYNNMSGHKDGFQFIWQMINGKENWNLNPWVWVISFKQISKPENFI